MRFPMLMVKSNYRITLRQFHVLQM